MPSEPTTVFPADLPAICAQLGVTRTALTAVLGEAAALSTPIPAGADIPSMRIFREVSRARPGIFIDAVHGTEILQQGADVYVPVSVDYMTEDVASGAGVACTNTFSV
ncbi:hypothetical protein [Nocardia donostiensis]|uniref:Uncharacterized protein n=1 Tax=Nocardia donostiensis TaxID=1538463 RepID=A0A1V2TA31_9NOCA|nr:hypothetical protein [Nocardia donostiensis]ONM46359.1 hypothetical protein B0T46_23545 [Nocardia donostiensis]OQS16680.1 hypothetical protein B0T36_03135 [Nocardia donostiensis]OQS18676.1 hypothetical protein B0T44_18435 [Nocardia donostiensis]